MWCFALSLAPRLRRNLVILNRKHTTSYYAKQTHRHTRTHTHRHTYSHTRKQFKPNRYSQFGPQSFGPGSCTKPQEPGAHPRPRPRSYVRRPDPCASKDWRSWILRPGVEPTSLCRCHASSPELSLALQGSCYCYKKNLIFNKVIIMLRLLPNITMLYIYIFNITMLYTHFSQLSVFVVWKINRNKMSKVL